jgi:hypothetical protein
MTADRMMTITEVARDHSAWHDVKAWRRVDSDVEKLLSSRSFKPALDRATASTDRTTEGAA